MSELLISDEMVERGADLLVKNDAEVGVEEARMVVREVLKAVFEGVPMNNYAIGTLLSDFDLVVVVKEFPARAAALVARRDPDRPPSEGFDTLGHYVTVNWKEKPSRHISSVQVSKLDPPTS